jgi:predicted metal-binding membrane protein
MTSSLEAILKRDRVLVSAALGIVVALAWGYLLAGAGTGMSAFHMTALPTAMDLRGPMPNMEPNPWTVGYASLMIVMWWLMMAAMMLPSATPMILLFAALSRKQQEAGAPFTLTGLFGAGYLTVWAGFSLLAVGLQGTLDRVALLSPQMVTTSLVLGAFLLIGAGVWQFTSLKNACLRNCRSPVDFLTRHWRNGPLGAFRMGVVHGLYCLGCCWMLMCLLFYGGIMNIYWIAGLATLVLIEKIVPTGQRASGPIGLALIAWGTTILFELM